MTNLNQQALTELMTGLIEAGRNQVIEAVSKALGINQSVAKAKRPQKRAKAAPKSPKATAPINAVTDRKAVQTRTAKVLGVKNFSKFLQDNNVTTTDFAARSGYSGSYVANVRAGWARPSSAFITSAKLEIEKIRANTAQKA